MTPSYVAFTDNERLIGDAAQNQVARNSTNSIFGTLLLHTCYSVFFFFLEIDVTLCGWIKEANQKYDFLFLFLLLFLALTYTNSAYDMICVLTAWENNNEINLTKFTKLNFFVGWWVRLGWIFCLFVLFLALTYTSSVYDICSDCMRKEKWNQLDKIYLTQYFCGLIMG